MSAPSPAPTPDALSDRMDRVEATQAKIASALEQLLRPDGGDPGRRKSGPFVRDGESILSSRGFQFSRIVGVQNKRMDPALAKVEFELCSRLQKEYVERGLYQPHESGGIVVPFSSELMLQAAPDMERFVGEVREVVEAGVAGADPHEVALIQKRLGTGVIEKTLSWQDAAAGGALVPPPVFGEPIALLRNQEVFLKAGARVIPFPASGRAVWPRFTGATTGYWLGSGVNDRTITNSEPTTGDLVLHAKKLGVLVHVPNELFRFPTVSVEQVVREDMMKTAALKMDRAFLEGVGSATEPKGIINYDSINAHTAGTVGVDGNTIEPEDILEMISEVEEQNLDFGCWVMRARMYAQLGNKRADAVAAGDGKGMFLFNVLRSGQQGTYSAEQPGTGMLEGYPVLKSNQVSRLREKGAATNLTYILGGDFSKYLVAMSGVAEFMITNLGDTNFAQDRSSLRLIFWCDGVPTYQEAFVLCDDLVVA